MDRREAPHEQDEAGELRAKRHVQPVARRVAAVHEQGARSWPVQYKALGRRALGE